MDNMALQRANLNLLLIYEEYALSLATLENLNLLGQVQRLREQIVSQPQSINN